MAPGFVFTICHEKRKDHRCELTIHQGPFKGYPKLAAASFPDPVAQCDGIEGCSLDCPDFALPIANCTTLTCDPLPPGTITKKK
jgi:hypothetical protein